MFINTMYTNVSHENSNKSNRLSHYRILTVINKCVCSLHFFYLLIYFNFIWSHIYITLIKNVGGITIEYTSLTNSVC